MSAYDAIVDGGRARVTIAGHTLHADLVFNCTYAALGSMGRIVLGIIAEHLIEVDRALNRRHNHHVLREVRSRLSSARCIRNIVEMP